MTLPVSASPEAQIIVKAQRGLREHLYTKGGVEHFGKEIG
jgi:hypothetical protein